MHNKTKEELIDAIHQLHHEIAELKKAVDQRSETAEALHETRHNLEMRIQQRTSELARTNVELREEIETRKKMEAKLRASEELYRGVVDHIGIGVAMINPDMEILTLNPQMRAWFPHANEGEQPVCYRVFNDPPREKVCSYCPTIKTLQDGQVHESVTETPAGVEIRNYRIISSPIKDADGTVIAAVEMVEDVTGKKIIR